MSEATGLQVLPDSPGDSCCAAPFLKVGLSNWYAPVGDHTWSLAAAVLAGVGPGAEP